MMGGRPRPVTKADLALSKKHSRQSIKAARSRMKDHRALAKKERRNPAAYKEEQWHIRNHRKVYNQERSYLKQLQQLKPVKAKRK